MRKIKLTRGKYALVDDEDYEELNQYSWHALESDGLWYARRTVNAPRVLGQPRAPATYIRMHCQILGRKGIDHINRNGLDNRRKNLRPATQSQNNANQRKRSGTRSRFRGVSWGGRNGWGASISVEKRTKHLGWFKSQRSAASAYDEAALVHFGQFAQLNFPGRTHAARHPAGPR